jgi:hypothetical protein
VFSMMLLSARLLISWPTSAPVKRLLLTVSVAI